MTTLTCIGIYLFGAVVTGAAITAENPEIKPLGRIILSLLWPIIIPSLIVMKLL